MKERLVLQNDVYWKRRGRYARLLDVHCRKCKNHIAMYQKDGAGTLRRLYLDRIFSPSSLRQLQRKKGKINKALQCRKCHEVLGTLSQYKQENRKIFRLYQDAVVTRIKRAPKKKRSSLHNV